ncbi:aminoglycoside phosphotransferase [Luteimonas aestuarii]|uniref:Aminoglycoside phosphotransferase n=1 Tax=Luteimonas aestuarii TaxID=453837 RepID=A0A4R5U1I9_9GAMM|nr:phosphotransferase [Luteimonas aestuarii]TDK27437.1 aminoglycoside phosphotransferase [Luteimonas aestuarii]
MDPSTLPTAREHQRLAWARAAAGNPALELERASVDAGFRSYWRTIGNVPSRIVMDSPPEKENVTGWLKVRELLRSGGVRVPGVLSEDAEQGFMLLEDLGPHTYLHVIDADNADMMFEAALAQLLKLQHIPVPDGFPAYNEEVLLRELRLFDEWFLGVHLGVSLDEAETERLFAVYRVLIDSALAQPQVLVHRDFMPRNLMPGDGDTAVIDFQDALHGPIAYDATCLFKDAFLSWPEERVARWQARYHALATEAGLPVPTWEQYRRDADLIGIHRHLKVIGIFARLNHRDGKPKYVADAPRFLAYLDAVLPRYPELQALADLLDAHVRPALQGASAAA